MALALAMPLASDEAPPPLRVLFPADQSVLESGRFELLAVLSDAEQEAPALRIDGKPAEWLPYGPPALVARLDLKPGRHEIALGSTKLAVYVRGDDALPPEVADRPVFTSHPGGADGWKDCASCHEVKKGTPYQFGTAGIGMVSPFSLNEPAACQACHTPEDFQLAHFHPEKPLAGCHNCHALHGSAEKSLLKGPTKKLCAACHD